MAEKGKKRKTGKRSSASQAQNPEYNTFMFRSVGCEKFHNSIVQKAANFIKEKAIFFDPGECEEMRENISRRGWETYVTYPKVASKALVFEFFSNVFPKTETDGSVTFPGSTSYVRGRTVAFDSDTINEIFGLRPVPVLDCFLKNKIDVRRMKENSGYAAEIREALCIPGMDWERNARGEPQKFFTSSLTPIAKGWASFIVSTILPSPCHTELSFDRAVLAACIIRGEPVNLGWVIERELNHFAEFKKDMVPSYWRYASLVALLCKKAGVEAEAGEATTPPAVAITGNWMRAKARLEHPVQREEPQQEPQQEQPDEQEPLFDLNDFATGPSEEDFRNLQERVAAVEANQEKLMSQNLVLRRAQERMIMENRFGMRALYRAIADQSGGQLDPEADIFRGLQTPQPPPQ